MKRSEINKNIKEMEALAKENGFHLPPFCNWTPKEWAEKDRSYDEIRDNMLGWDITDFGCGDFEKIGFSLITLRNGNLKKEDNKKVYAEKLITLKEHQKAPMHYHAVKTEDIINRGGGTLLISVYNHDGNSGLSEEEVCVNKDGRRFMVKAGTTIEIKPGESITLTPHQYHNFAVKQGTGHVLIGEVSSCNDDDADNFFYEKMGRFPEVEEDEEPYRYLCNEYPKVPEN